MFPPTERDGQFRDPGPCPVIDPRSAGQLLDGQSMPARAFEERRDRERLAATYDRSDFTSAIVRLRSPELAARFVREVEHVADDFGSPLQWWRNRLLRIFLVFLLTTFGALAGNYVGLAEMFSKF